MIRNPVLKGFNPDPSICRAGEDYYIAVSTFEWFPGIRIYHSRDLINWRLAAQPLDRVGQLNMVGNPDSGGVWAPCLSYADGKFWLVYSDVKVVEGDAFKDVTNCLSTCETIDGEWSDPVTLNGVGFDSSLFHDDDGRKYLLNMLWDHRPGHHRFAGITLQEYSHAERRLVGSRKIIFRGTALGLTEAPHLYKRDGMYYLLVAEGGTTYEHAAVMARSTAIDGPYELHPSTPFLTSWNVPENPLQKAGHASMVETHNGKCYIAHLVGRPIRPAEARLLTDRGYCPLGRETALQKIEWKDGWPWVVGGTAPALDVEGPGLPEMKWERDYPVRDEFDGSALNTHFQPLRVPFTGEMGSLTARKGRLRLYGQGSPQSTFAQSLVARRWQSLSFDAATAVEFAPENFQQLAGLICYYNTRNWVYAHVSHDEEKGRVVSVLQCDRNRTRYPSGGGRR